ncbi:MAG: hypothetical protein QN130_12455 [Armatimonadota bacterium]|nr:hypothetical protein [Armatimonadota bacterium]
MPISQYDRYFGGRGGAQKALRAMKKQYGPERGERIFYATLNQRRRRRRTRAA